MDEIRMRSSLFGFKKRDVYNYISELSERNAAKLAAKDAEASQLRSEYYSLRQEHEKLKSESTLDVEKLKVGYESKIKEADFYAQRLKSLESERENVLLAMVSAEAEAKKIIEQAKVRAEDIIVQMDDQILEKHREMDSITQDIKILRAQMASISEKFSAQIEDTIREHVIENQ